MPVLAVSAYQAGEVVGGLLPLLLGIALVVVGVRRRRASTAAAPGWGYEAAPAAPAPSWAPAPADPDAAPAARADNDAAAAAAPAAAEAVPSGPAPTPWPATPERPRGTGLVAGGIALIVLSLLGGVLAAVNRESSRRRVELPSSVIGLARDQTASEQAGKQVLSGVPSGLIDTKAAVYGALPKAVLVIAARANTSVPSSQVDDFRKGIERSGGKLENGRNVDAGSLGGSARCWEAVISTVRPGVCVFVDRGSLVATIDFLGGGVDAAAKRGLQIREATVSKA